jgi:hypothetical protein
LVQTGACALAAEPSAISMAAASPSMTFKFRVKLRIMPPVSKATGEDFTPRTIASSLPG